VEGYRSDSEREIGSKWPDAGGFRLPIGPSSHEESSPIRTMCVACEGNLAIPVTKRPLSRSPRNTGRRSNIGDRVTFSPFQTVMFSEGVRGAPSGWAACRPRLTERSPDRPPDPLARRGSAVDLCSPAPPLSKPGELCAGRASDERLFAGAWKGRWLDGSVACEISAGATWTRMTVECSACSLRGGQPPTWRC
jgi:hypothetical protein